jgi:hypothetical protein
MEEVVLATPDLIFDEGVTVILVATPHSNYTFYGWYEDGSLVMRLMLYKSLLHQQIELWKHTLQHFF